MKKRRVMGALLAGIMAMALSVPASAVDITIDGSAASYDAFRLLNLTTSLKSEDDVVHESHEAGQHTDACYNYAYTVNDKYLAVMQEAMPEGVGDTDADGTVSGSEIITYLSTLTSNSADIQGIGRPFLDTLIWYCSSHGSLAGTACVMTPISRGRLVRLFFA